jgi:hypothetical protein
MSPPPTSSGSAESSPGPIQSPQLAQDLTPSVPQIAEASVTAQQANHRKRHRRAATACMACHKRRIRCDAETTGHACSTCSRWKIECTPFIKKAVLARTE